VTDLAFDQSWVQVGTPVEISVNVTNIGDVAGEFSLNLLVNDVKRETKVIHTMQPI